MNVITITLNEEGRIAEVDFVQWILNEIESPAYKRQDIADTYAILIRKGHKDFTRINEAILSRWSKSGFRWIKERAWKQIEERAA